MLLSAVLGLLGLLRTPGQSDPGLTSAPIVSGALDRRGAGLRAKQAGDSARTPDDLPEHDDAQATGPDAASPRGAVRIANAQAPASRGRVGADAPRDVARARGPPCA